MDKPSRFKERMKFPVAVAAAAVAMALLAGSAGATLQAVGSPFVIGSWSQGFNETGVGPFDQVNVQIISGGPFDTPHAQSGFDDGTWLETFNNTSVSVAKGNASTNLTWNINFQGSSGSPLSFYFMALNAGAQAEVARADWNGASWAFSGPPALNLVSAVSPTVCLTSPVQCADIPVILNRGFPTRIQGYSVTFQLTNLVLCADPVQGSYISGGTTYYVTDNGGGSYTVDCTHDGPVCSGSDPLLGTLFTVPVKGVAEGIGTLVITGVTLRDCLNNTLASGIGFSAEANVDFTPPTAVAGLAASQQLLSNPGLQNTNINLSWTLPTETGSSVEVFRKGYGNYPEYLPGGVPATPANPAAALSAGWVSAGTVSSPGVALTDYTTTRDYYYYVAFVTDACGNVSAVSSQTSGTLNYHLGDVAGNGTCTGDKLVDGVDVSALATYYGQTLSLVDARACLDVGPTTTSYVDGRPVPDNRLNFEDLILYAINFGVVSMPQMASLRVAARDQVTVDAPASVSAGQTFVALVRMSGAGVVQGLSAQLGWDAAVAEPVGMEPGELITGQNGVVFSARPGNVDAAVLGTDRTIAGEGVVARVTFRALANGTPNVRLASLDARSPSNQRIDLGFGVETPRTTVLMPVAPNPFRNMSTLSFAMAKAGPAELAVYSVDGRRVRTLVKETREAGVYRLTWDGTDDHGTPQRAGLYFVRLVTAQGRFTRTMAMLK